MIKGILLAILLSATAWAQTGSTNSMSTSTGSQQTNAPQKNLKLAPGSVIPVQLTKSIDARKAKTGEEVTARVSQDLKSNSGQVVLPKDTEVIGRVTEAQVRSKQQPQSEIGIAFERAVEKNGVEMQMPMSIQAVIGQANNGSEERGGMEQPEQSTVSSPGMPGNMHQPGMEESNAPPAGNLGPSQNQTAPRRPQITGKTQGVVGIPNVKLEQTVANTQGSVVTSQKKDLKLDSGTIMLLKVD